VDVDAAPAGRGDQFVGTAVTGVAVDDQECRHLRTVPGLSGSERWADRPIRTSGARPIIVLMEDSGILHHIQDDLSERWVETWAEGGVKAIETYLAKHLAFLSYLDLDEASA
jgi:hypothetical protein